MRKNPPNSRKVHGKSVTSAFDGTDTIFLDGFLPELEDETPKKRMLNQIHGRGEHMCQVFELMKDHLDWELLANAKTPEDIRRAFGPGAMVYRDTLQVSDEFLLSIVQDKNFPKTVRGRVAFMGSSCANWGRTSPRRSRDLFEEAKRVAKT